MGGGGGSEVWWEAGVESAVLCRMYSSGWFDLSPVIKDGVILQSEGTQCPSPSLKQQQYNQHQSALIYGRFTKVKQWGNRLAVVVVYDSV